MLEPTGLTRSDGKRPDGLTLFPWSQGRCLVWDFTCRDTLAPSNVMATSEEAGKAAEIAEKEKMSHYQELSTSYIVTPVATETLGPWGPSGLKFVKEIGSKIADLSGEKRATSFLFQSISMAVQRGNVASIRGSMPNTKTLNGTLLPVNLSTYHRKLCIGWLSSESFIRRKYTHCSIESEMRL